MTFTFAAAVAWDPIGNKPVKNVSFQVYATTDTAYATPLAITDPFGNAIPGNILNSGSQGVFPQFNQATNSAVVITDPAHTYAWTLNAVMQDASVAAYISTPGSATASQLSATYVPKWKAATAYLAGDKVLSPNGDVVSAIANFTSGTSFNPANWNLSPTYAAPIIVQPGDNVATKWAAAEAAGRDLVITPGTYALTAGLTWQSYKHSVIGMGDVTLDFTGMASGYAITVRGVGTLGNAYNHRALNTFKGIRILGPDTDATTVDGFLFQESVGNNLDSVPIQNCNIFGFRDQVVFGDNVWSIKFDNVNFQHWHRYACDFQCTNNAGEQFTFQHCRWANGTNTGGTATAINTNLTAKFLDIAVFGGSMDYNNIDIEHRSGTLSFFGTHFENSNTTPMGFLSYTASYARTVLNMFGTEIYPTEAYASARDHCFEIRSTSGGGVHYSLSGVSARFFDRNTWLVKNLSGQVLSNASVRGNNIDFSVGTNGVGKVSTDTDLLISGDMNGAAFLGSTQVFGGWWRQGTVTYSFDSTVTKEGANSLKMVGDGTAATTGAAQMFRLNAGTRYLITGYYRVDVLTAGSTDIQFRQYSTPSAGAGIPGGAAGTQSSLVTNMLNLAAVTSGWVPFSRVISTQNWAAIGSVQFNNNNLNGTVYLDDWHVWEIS